MQQTHDVPHYADVTRTKISNAERTERRAGKLLAEKKQVVHQATKEAVEHGQWHEQTLRDLLRQKADDKARLGLSALLTDLTETYGLGWSELARLVGVSVPAVRKWRLGGDISPPKLSAVSRLAAFLELLGAEGVQDPAAWLNLPLEGENSSLITKTQIYTSGHPADLLLYAKQHLSQRQLLERSELKEPPPSRNAMLLADDAHLSIVPIKN